MSKLVSVIVPCYNQAQYLDECLQSVIRQTYATWECIIVNDGSSDNTSEIINKWIEKDSRFKFVSKQNGGVCQARNLGASITKGFYLLPLDADDYISENYISELIKNIEINNYKIVYGRAFFFGERNEEFQLENVIQVKDLLQYNRIHCSGLFKRDDFFLIGGYDEKMKFGFEDWEFWINMLKDGGQAIKIENCFLYYRIKENSRSTEIDKNQIKTQQMQEYILKKHILSYGYNSVLEMYLKNMKLMNFLEKPHQYFFCKAVISCYFN
ncbi:Undecaprenyl-phosphate 4-deoxy-4-formamido-L-arabinose transferase [Flavobacterium bizetiae]|uniref:Undecaprenyl-phosphate 4-deoxy-4-formamido-L-arabinose transferase n=1 Tax=Flavobacterium bizetiae TaxID=2704140 RepID=A0A6J4GXK2_9FLAO|nr:glycosyltransferase family A protein [Flavobacterium bizetiae]CAA9203642.1 Undecaprenyl-phosphate 4-deoxy-4-formamido-L-arabinose transferase [Flavobacterium bizetiae]